MNAIDKINQIKKMAEKQETAELVKALVLFAAKETLEMHERMVRAAISDVIEEREGLDFILALEDDLEKAQEEIGAKHQEIKESNTVKDDGFPELKRTYTYRKQTIIKHHDLAL